MIRFIQNIWLRKGEVQFLPLYFFLILNTSFLFFGNGSFLERINHNWPKFKMGFWIFLVLFIIWFIIYDLLVKNKLNNMQPRTRTFSTCITYAILGSFFLLMCIAQLIWNIVPFQSSFYSWSIILCLSYGMVCWTFALLDPTYKKITWGMLKKTRTATSEKDYTISSTDKNVVVLDKKRGKVILILLLFSIFFTGFGVIKIFILSKKVDGIIETIASVLTVIILVCLLKNTIKKYQTKK